MISKLSFGRLIAAASLSLCVLNGVTPMVSAAKLASSQKTVSSNLGNDISYPQCGKQLPTGQAFGLVGINGGTAAKDNPCLGSELQWAGRSGGNVTSQKKIQLYVNTANPGDLSVASWPSSTEYPAGKASTNPYGSCDGSDSDGCAWQYGWNRAYDDVQSRFIPTATSLGMDADPSHYPWWLDVETVNSWETNSSAALSRNAHDLEGMMAYLGSIGVTQAGIYSTSYQWNQIVGSTVSVDSNLNHTLSWLAGSSSQSAKFDCLKPPLTTGSFVVMTQYVANRLDYDYSCI